VITEIGRDVTAAAPVVKKIWKEVEKREEVGENGGGGPPLAGA